MVETPSIGMPCLAFPSTRNAHDVMSDPAVSYHDVGEREPAPPRSTQHTHTRLSTLTTHTTTTIDRFAARFLRPHVAIGARVREGFADSVCSIPPPLNRPTARTSQAPAAAPGTRSKAKRRDQRRSTTVRQQQAARLKPPPHRHHAAATMVPSLTPHPAGPRDGGRSCLLLLLHHHHDRHPPQWPPPRWWWGRGRRVLRVQQPGLRGD
jgi:hypothetical protein